jgi:hypothetical protein
LNHFIEKPRFSLLRDACQNDDYFYVALHQMFCVWTSDPDTLLKINGVPDLSTLKIAFSIVATLIRDNTSMSPQHQVWFSQFPGPLEKVMQVSGRYLQTVNQVVTFLRKLVSDWSPLTSSYHSRGYPPLVDELVHRLNLLSPVLQGVVFTATRRNLGILDDEIGAQMEQAFSQDREGYRQLAARYYTACPPTEKEITDRNKWLATHYLDLRQRQQDLRRSSATNTASSPAMAYFSGNGNGQRSSSMNSIPSNINQASPVTATFPMPQSRLAAGASAQPLYAQPTQTSQPSTPTLGSFPASQRSFSTSHLSTANNQPQRLAQRIITPVLQDITPSNAPVPTFQTPQHFVLANSRTSVNQTPQNQPLQNQTPQMQYSENQLNWGMPFLPSNSTSGDTLNMAQNYAQEAARRAPQNQQFLANGRRRLQSNGQIFTVNPSVTPAVYAIPTTPTSNLSITAPQQGMAYANAVNQFSNGNMIQQQQSYRPMLSQANGQVVNMNGIHQQLQQHPALAQLEKSLVPPAGYVQPLQLPNPNMTAVHQAHLRSPVLYAVDLENGASQSDQRYYQALNSFAVNPTILLPNRPLAKFELRVQHLEYSDLTHDKPTSSKDPPKRDIRQGSKQYRIRITKLPKDKTSPPDISEWVVAESFWPPTTFLDINGNDLEIRRKTLHSKDLPIDITPYVLDAGSNGLHKIRVSMPTGKARDKDVIYCFAVEVVEVFKHKQIMDMCLQEQRISANETLSSIKSALSGSEDDDNELSIIPADLTIDLKDPFMAKVFNTPVKGATCLHRECFDLETFLTTRPAKPGRDNNISMVDVWKCPLCGRDARPQMLRVDDFLLDVRTKLESMGRLEGDEPATAILVSPNGNWRIKEEAIPQSNRRKSRTGGRFGDDDSDDEVISTGEGTGLGNRENSTSSFRNPRIAIPVTMKTPLVVIDLLDD